MKLMVSVDTGSDVPTRTEGVALRVARAFGASPTVVHAVSLENVQYKSIPEFQVEMIRDQATKRAQGALDKVVDRMQQAGVQATGRLLVGEAAPSLLRVLEDEQVDLCVVGSRGKAELSELLFGSFSNDLVYHAACPVLVAKQELPDPAASEPLRVLGVVDLTAKSRRALTFLENCARPEGFELTFLFVVDPVHLGLALLTEKDREITLQEAHKEARAFLEVKAERFTELGFKVNLEVGEGDPREVVTERYADGGFEMLVTGRCSSGELQDIVKDSVCHHVARAAPVNILLVP